MINLKIINKEEIGKKLIPEKIFKFNYKTELSKVYEKLYFDNLHSKIFSNFFALSIFISFFLFFLSYDLLYTFFNEYFYHKLWKFLIIFITYFFINLICFYCILFSYFFYHESKFTKNQTEIEKDLPDFLDNLVSNLKGGISLEKALLKSVRPEQKALLAEVTLINQKIMMGDNVYLALKQFRQRFNSKVIQRTFFLIEEGIKGGGNLVAPLEKISQNLKKIYNLNNEVKANSVGFSLIIKAISIFVTPLLFALAITLLNFIGNLFKMILKSETTVITVSELPIEFSEYLQFFSYSMIILITFFSSLITSELKGEKLYDSIKYLPFYIILSIILFKIFSAFLLTFFGNIF